MARKGLASTCTDNVASKSYLAKSLDLSSHVTAHYHMNWPSFFVRWGSVWGRGAGVVSLGSATHGQSKAKSNVNTYCYMLT